MMYFLMLRIFRFSLLSPAGTLSSSSSFSRFIYFLSGCNLAFFLPFFLPILYPFFLRPPEKERAQIYWRLSLREEEEEEKEERALDPRTEKETKTGRQCHISALVPLFPLLLVFLATDQVSPVQLVALGCKKSRCLPLLGHNHGMHLGRNLLAFCSSFFGESGTTWNPRQLRLKSPNDRPTPSHYLGGEKKKNPFLGGIRSEREGGGLFLLLPSLNDPPFCRLSWEKGPARIPFSFFSSPPTIGCEIAITRVWAPTHPPTTERPTDRRADRVHSQSSAPS